MEPEKNGPERIRVWVGADGHNRWCVWHEGYRGGDLFVRSDLAARELESSRAELAEAKKENGLLRERVEKAERLLESFRDSEGCACELEVGHTKRCEEITAFLKSKEEPHPGVAEYEALRNATNKSKEHP